MPSNTSRKQSDFGRLIIGGAKDALAHKRGELAGVTTTRGKVTIRKVDVVPPPEFGEEEIQRVRERLGVSQTVFARLLGASAATVRAWERGARRPSDMARRLLELMEREPEVFVDDLRAAE